MLVENCQHQKGQDTEQVPQQSCHLHFDQSQSCNVFAVLALLKDQFCDAQPHLFNFSFMPFPASSRPIITWRYTDPIFCSRKILSTNLSLSSCWQIAQRLSKNSSCARASQSTWEATTFSMLTKRALPEVLLYQIRQCV